MDLPRGSADALATLTDELDSVSSGKASDRAADELFMISQTLRAEPGLRRIATDAALETSAKQGLMKQIFEGKVSADTLGLLLTAVSSRWTRARDLATSLERLSELAVLRSAGKDAGTIADELFGFARTVATDPDLRDALANPQRSIEDRSELVAALLDGKVKPATVTLAKQALAGTYGTVGSALETYRGLAAGVAGEGVATVYVAQELTKSERDRLQKALARQYDRDIHLNEVVDASVLGGIRVEIGDDVIDGTVSSRLDDARRRLAG
jgi:F-type H+-transporting ATPase subunit delta